MKTVEELAREAGFVVSDVFGPLVDGRPVGANLESFASLVLEEAAKVCDDIWQDDGTALLCRDALRAMKGQK